MIDQRIKFSCCIFIYFTVVRIERNKMFEKEKHCNTKSKLSQIDRNI